MLRKFFAKITLSKAVPHRLSNWHRTRLDLLSDHEAAEGAAILETGQWNVAGFGTIKLSEEIWLNADDLSRTLAWKLHQFAFLPSLIAHDRKFGSNSGSEFSEQLIKAWWDQFRGTPRIKNNMAWHDHATALRLNNFLLLRSFIEQPDARLELICREYGRLLAREAFYERGNNHGFDQSLALFEYGHEMNAPRMHALAAKRILQEIRTAFASDGGHVENSTGYHHFGIHQVKQANKLSVAYTGHSIETSGLIARAENILAHMTRPDRKLPHIGDTQDFVVRRLDPPVAADIALPVSGWAFFRSGWDARAIHGAFKSGFLSQSHRQDDDLSLSLFGFGEEWLVDGGLFAHQPKDPMRVYMRSAQAHCLPYVVGVKPSRDIAAIGAHSRIVDSTSDDERFEVTGETKMWPGFDVRRRIVFIRADASIRITDSIIPQSKQARQRAAERAAQGYAVYGSRFLVSGEKRISRSADGVVVNGPNANLMLCTKLSSKVIEKQEKPYIAGWRSTKANVVTPAFDISFTTSAEEMDETFVLRWV